MEQEQGRKDNNILIMEEERYDLVKQKRFSE